ncbi:MAG: hypothetical protein J6W29_03575 [Neisseriaceae bacterium]|nr:hypothetical protein [Neisseriaceae bacterium]
MDDFPEDWKLKLRYGKLQTPYHHFTAIVDGVVEEEMANFDCPKGFAFMGMNLWAENYDMVVDMVNVFAENIGFKIKKHNSIYIYDTEPKIPPQEHPQAYDIKFYPYNE